MNLIKLSPLCVLSLFLGCTGETPEFDALRELSTSRVTTPTTETPRVDREGTVTHQRPHLLDAQGRYVQIRGINVSGSHKAPPTEVHLVAAMPEEGAPAGERTRPSRYPIDTSRPECLSGVPIPNDCYEAGPDGRPCFETDTCFVNYDGSPFPIEEADKWFGQMESLGFNSVRLITNWESIQPYKPGSSLCRESDRYTDDCYDLKYLDYYEQLIVKAKEHGIYVLVDMHQDIFSRHIMNLYNESPSYIEAGELKQALPGTLDHTVLSLFPPYTDWVRGHGAPRWVVQTCLPEKKMDSPYWGMFRGIGQLTNRDGSTNVEILGNLNALLSRFDPGGTAPAWLPDILLNRPERRFEVNETSDILPLTPWVAAGAISMDVDRCFAALFAGDIAFPNLVVDDDGVTKRRDVASNSEAPDLKEYLQDKYTFAFLELVKRSKAYDNVIGYDVMNEPVGVFLMMAIGGFFKDLVGLPDECEAPIDCVLPSGCTPGSDEWPGCLPAELVEDGELPEDAYMRLVERAPDIYECVDERGLVASNSASGDTLWCRTLGSSPAASNALITHGNRIEEFVISLLGEDLGGEIFAAVRSMQLLPTDAHPHTMYQWGLSEVDGGAAFGMNFGFEEEHLQPFFERVGRAIQEEDPNAIIWFEPPTSLRLLTGPMRFWDQPLTRPKGIRQLVYAPHWYPDIYPNFGINSKPRRFNADEFLYRDFTGPLRHHVEEAPEWLGNIPVVYGEFGTYFSLGLTDPNLDPEIDNDLAAHVLNSYYEAFEELGIGNMVWCFSANNSAKYGEDWNHEDFSIIGPDGEPRAWPAYVRTYARSSSGKVIKQRFVSQYHFWDPESGKPRPTGLYEMSMERRESKAPTEIYVPSRVYGDGFYVWLSDGNAYYDHDRQVLYWYPSRDEPDTIHKVRIEPHLGDREALGWSYFFNGESALVGAGDSTLTGGEVLR